VILHEFDIRKANNPRMCKVPTDKTLTIGEDLKEVSLWLIKCHLPTFIEHRHRAFIFLIACLCINVASYAKQSNKLVMFIQIFIVDIF
jgi:hypothetical protein